MTTNINISVEEIQQGGSSRYSVTFKCHEFDKTAVCPVPTFYKILKSSYNDSQISQAQSLSILAKTGGKGGSRSKISKRYVIYDALLSLDPNRIRDLINTIGVAETSKFVFKLVRTSFRTSSLASLQSIVDEITGSLIDTIEELLNTISETISNIDSSQTVFINCLEASSEANVVYDETLDNHVMVFNNDTSFNSLLKYGIYQGTYNITNIPFNHPIAVLNGGITDIVQYSGNTIPYYKTVNNIQYKFYHGTLTLTIQSDFTYDLSITGSDLSFYSYYRGFMGMESKFRFSSTCATITGFIIVQNPNCIANTTIDLSISDVSSNTDTSLSSYYGSASTLDNVSDISFVYTFDNSLNDVSGLSQSAKNVFIYDPSDIRVSNGSYIFNVPQDYPLLITASGGVSTSNQLLFNGDISKSYLFNDYRFFYDQTVLTVSGDFGTADIFMLYNGKQGATDVSKVELQKPLIFDNTCTPKIKESIINIIIQIQLEIKVYNAVSDLGTTNNILKKIASLQKVLDLISIIIRYLFRYYFSLGIELTTQTIYTLIISIQSQISTASEKLNILKNEVSGIYNTNIGIRNSNIVDSNASVSNTTTDIGNIFSEAGNLAENNLTS